MIKRKLSITLSLILLSILSVRAQEAKWQHQLGFDAGNFVRNFVNFSGSGSTVGPAAYPLQFKALKAHKREEKTNYTGFRTGLGLKVSNSAQTSSSTSNRTENLQLDARIGMEFQRAISGRFMVFYGPDLLVSHNKITNTNSTGAITLKSISEKNIVGAGMVWGLQFNLHKRIYIGTEMNYYGRFLLSKSSGVSGNNEVKLNNFSLELALPTVLYCNLVF